MRNKRAEERVLEQKMQRELGKRLPNPTTSFRRRAWLQFQRALDPLARPKPLRFGRR